MTNASIALPQPEHVQFSCEMPASSARAGEISAAGLQAMVTWVREREAVRKRREAGEPWPWTDDPLLREYRWCNVRRADDRVSQELLQHWYDPAASAPVLLAAAALGRLVNWPAALLDASRGQPFSMAVLPLVRARLAMRTERGEKVFTGAYIVPGVPGRSKVDSVCDLVDVIARRARGVLGGSMRETWAALTEFDGLGSFLAGQIVADLALLPAGAAWPDAQSWAPVGPGSARGWNRITGNPLNRAVPQDVFDIALPKVFKAVRAAAPDICADRQLIAYDLQSVLCEVDKYLRLKAGEGTVRARYRPVIQHSLL